MRAGETLVANDGYEVALFHMPYLRMSQDEGGDYSHQGTYNIDFLGWGPNGRILAAPMYAPCKMKLLHYWTAYANGNMQVWESVNKVHLANGQLDYLTLMVAHDNHPPYSTLGTVVNQGTLFYHTGTYGNVTGDHVHTCVGQGRYQGFTTRPPQNHEDLTNRIHYWNGLYVNDTVISQGYGHNWKTWTEPTPTPSPTPIVTSEGGFPWFIYYNRWKRDLR